jgi:hypothetical protein
MNTDYTDIISKAGEPRWYDENGVPRYTEFHPDKCVLLGAEEAFLIEIRCQACNRPFLVALTWKDESAYWLGNEMPRLPRLTTTGGDSLSYGDPPNIKCCASGPTMSSDFHRIIEAWVRTTGTRIWLNLDQEAIDAIGAKSEVGEWV